MLRWTSPITISATQVISRLPSRLLDRTASGMKSSRKSFRMENTLVRPKTKPVHPWALVSHCWTTLETTALFTDPWNQLWVERFTALMPSTPDHCTTSPSTDRTLQFALQKMIVMGHCELDQQTMLRAMAELKSADAFHVQRSHTTPSRKWWAFLSWRIRFSLSSSCQISWPGGIWVKLPEI